MRLCSIFYKYSLNPTVNYAMAFYTDFSIRERRKIYAPDKFFAGGSVDD